MFGRKPDLVTALITRRKDRSFEVQYIGDDSGSPNEPKPAATLVELRAAIDPALVTRYGEKLPDNGMGVGYAIYPWREGKVPKTLAREVGIDFLVFDVEEVNGAFRATESKTGLAASADSLDALVAAIAEKVGSHWPSLIPEVPGMLNWQRVLTESGFVPFRR
jgi:hypothetical protein